MLKCKTARLWLCMCKTSGFIDIVQVAIYLDKHSQPCIQCETGTHHKTSVSQGTGSTYLFCVLLQGWEVLQNRINFTVNASPVSNKQAA